MAARKTNTEARLNGSFLSPLAISLLILRQSIGLSVRKTVRPSLRPLCFHLRVAITDGTLIRAEEGPKVLASPPTAFMAQAIYLVAVADYTLGEYNWRHCGDF